MVVSFCGHSEVYPQDRIEKELRVVIGHLITEGTEQFLLGGYGQFDLLAAKVVAEEKKTHPEIESILVVPYLDRKYDLALYDRTLYPGLEKAPLRFAVRKRNEYMMDAADVVVAYVTHSWGGAAKTLEYAKRRNKKIIMLGSGLLQLLEISGNN
ncbi:MAG: hypothetical protein IKO91_03680 [Oscillospiraceae bacterium]|nr:hypothetical protein [Oscillospiraceae bacterium]